MAGTLLLLVVMVIHLITSCPSSCMICLEDVTLCQGLTHVLAVPITTKALIVTDGKITSIKSFNLSLLFNLTLLRLSSNRITDIKEDAFNGLKDLRILLLDQNKLSSSSITDNTFSELQKLQVLVLSNNALSTIYGTWFKNMTGLIRLQLNGNQITNLTEESFGNNHLNNLRSLDLSNNFISNIQKNAFQGLPQLQELDLSRNRMALIPDTFSPLTQLILLNLDENQWTCTCQLCDLAAFLRSYRNSSTRLLENANNLHCRAPRNPAVHSVLDLTEANCEPEAENIAAILKNKTMNFYERNTALVAVFCFTGAVGLTCLILALFKWKLQQGKANEHVSENCCCRTLDESQCGHEPRKYLTMGYCNCHLTQENEIKVMSIVGSSREMPLLQENRHHETENSMSIGLDTSLQSIQRENEHQKSSSSVCFKCRLMESCPQELYGNMPMNNEAVTLTKDFYRRDCKPSSFEQWEDLQTTVLHDLSKINHDTRNDTFNRRCTIPASLAAEKLEQHLTNELWQSPSKPADRFKVLSLRHFITSASSVPNMPVNSKECCIQKTLQSHRSQHSDQCESLERSTNSSLQPGSPLICKYVDCDELQSYMKEKKESHREKLKLEKEQIKGSSRIVESGLMSDEEIPLSPGVKKRCIPKNVSFYVPDLATANRLDAMTMDSNEAEFHKKQLQKSIQRSQTIILKNRGHDTSEARSADSLLSSHPRIFGNESWLRENEISQKCKMRHKGQDCLTVKLNLLPFRKVRIHPDKSPFSEKLQQKSSHHPKQLPNETEKKMSPNSKELKRTEGKTNCTSSSVTKVQPGTREKRVMAALQFPEKQLSAGRKNVENAAIIINNDAVEFPEESCSYPVVNVSQPFMDITYAGNTKGVPPYCSTEAIIYNSNSPPPSPHELTKIVTPVFVEPQNSQNRPSCISKSLYSMEESGEEMTEFPVSHMHQNSKMTAALALTIQRGVANNTEENISNNASDTELDSHVDDPVQNTSQSRMGSQELQSQDENLVKERLESPERTEECDLLGESLRAEGSQTVPVLSRIPPDYHIVSTEPHLVPSQSGTTPLNDTNSLHPFSQANGHLTSRSKEGTGNRNDLHKTENMEDNGMKTEQRENKKPCNDNESLFTTLIPETQLNSAGPTEYILQVLDDVNGEKGKTYHKNNVMSNTSSITTSPETENILPGSNTNLQMNNNSHMENVHNTKDLQNNQPNEGNNVPDEGEMPVEEHKKPFFTS